MRPNEFERFAVGHMGVNSHTFDDYRRHVNGQVSPITGLTPYIIEERQLNVAAMDVFSRLMMDRIIWMGTAIYDEVANIICAQLLFLDSVDAKKDVNLYINSPGGSVYAGLSIYDVMQYVRPDVATVCTGMAASMGAVLMCSGVAGKRVALPHARIMIHQPSGGAQGVLSDIQIAVEQIVKMKKELYSIIATHSGQPFEKVERDSDRDYWMTGEEAKEYGLVDEVLKSQKQPAPGA